MEAKYCGDCGNLIPSSDEFCSKCGDKKKGIWMPIYSNEKSEKEIEGSSSGWWMLMPICLGFIGGFIAFLILRKEDNWSARLYLGMGIVVLIIHTIMYFVWLEIIFSYLPF